MESSTKLSILDDSPAGRRWTRRELAQVLLSGAAGISLPALAAEHPVRKHLAHQATMAAADAKTAATKWAPEFLTPHQEETLAALAERIVPGATRAQATRFIDLLLSVEAKENQQRFANSLAAFDGEALRRFHKAFKALPEAQQIELLTLASAQEPGRTARGSRASGQQQRLTLRDHLDHIKGWAAGAYYSSEIGMRELGWTPEMAWDSFPGCQHPGGHA